MVANSKYRVSILIVTFNNAHTIIDCIDSLEKQHFRDFEILVRDNHSVDSTLDLIKRYDSVTVDSAEKNEGFALAMNYLSSKATGEYLFMLNPDCICPPDTLGILHEFMKDHPGVVSPLLVYPDGRPQASARIFPDYKNILFSRQSPLYQLGVAGATKAGYIQSDKLTKVDVVSATALFIAKNLFDLVGGFDERFFLYLEDVDLCLRLRGKKIDVWYLPTVRVQHSLGASSSKFQFGSLYYHHLSMLKYFAKHYPRNYANNFILMVLLVAGFLLSSALKILGIRRQV